MGQGVDFRLLGPLDLRHGGNPVDPGTPKQRTILALLLLHPNQLVSAARMVDELWPGGAPKSAVANVTTYVSRLRRLLSGIGCEIRRRGSAYSLHTTTNAIDFNRFVDLVALAETAWRGGDTAASVDHWEGALAIWRGQAFEGVPTGPELETARAGWQERRLTAFESYARARLRHGDAGDLLPLLRAHTSAEPLRETGWLLLMAALRLAGNSAAALEAYEQARLTLAERLGADPGNRLRELHQAILTGSETVLSIVDERASIDARPGPVPAQLPLDISGFAGRQGELRCLDDALRRARERPTALPITAIAGMAGVGKTTLAVHWAHRVSAQFPDGQLYVNLSGFSLSGNPSASADVLKGFLDALDVPADRIPSDVDARAALYRTLLAKRRMLVLLDNAASAEQVRPLLPGASGCLVLVTSRTQLPGLLAGSGAEPLMLGLLSAHEAQQMLAERLGAGRVAAEPEALQDIISCCMRLPLALAIVAARAAIRPAASLTMFAEELRAVGSGLDAFTAEDAVTDVRAVFASSYRALGPAQARLFRLLGVHPGPDITIRAAASVAGLPLDRAALLLGELARVHLLIEHQPHRYTFHDLLRAYAAELHAAIDSQAERESAVRRLLDHCLHSSLAAARLLSPQRDPIGVPEAGEGVVLQAFADDLEAMAWFATEHRVLLAALDLATRGGLDTYAEPLAWAMTDFLQRKGHWQDQAAVHAVALAAATRLDDRAAQARAHRHLSRAYILLDRLDDAHIHYRYALDLAWHLGDTAGQAHVHLNVANLLERQECHGEALEHAQEALRLFAAVENLSGRARARNMVGWFHARLGHYDQALAHCRQALAELDEIGDSQGQAFTLDSLGYAHHHLGQNEEAIACYRRALALAKDFCGWYQVAEVLIHLGDTYDSAADAGNARDSWQQALTILDEFRHPDAEAVRARIG